MKYMYRIFLKRMIDLILALLAFPFFIIILMVLAPIIYLEDRGSVFYNAPRMGQNGKIFKMYKFRSMRANAPDIRNSDGSTYNGYGDLRVTMIGKFIRKTSLDELPQLINIIKGDMSIIGPRPNLATKSYDSFDEIRRKRVSVRPGITGYSQAYFRNSISQDEKFSNDCYYVDNVNFIFDIKIFFRTIITVLKRENIYVEGNIDIPTNMVEEKTEKSVV